ncbi:cellulose binding domain-containing protein, partial [Actinoplanes sp. NPDC051633]|uniref:cellulose binding domain-containing protein n=1 Tax=Actinoplanes sp. NPDC051633 TaxID=3155670 RepID=UPI00344A4C20
RDSFVRANGCTAQNPPEPAQGSGTHITTTYSGCRAGYPVQWAAHDGDHVPLPVDRNASTSWVAAEVWQFFTQFGSTTPPSSPSSPTSPDPGSPQPGGPCSVTSTVNAWGNGLTANLTVTNTGSSAINGWTLAFSLAPGQTITNGWSATYSPSSGRVTATNVSYNAALAPGASVSFGFQATHSGNAGAPTAYALNGSSCTTG